MEAWLPAHYSRCSVYPFIYFIYPLAHHNTLILILPIYNRLITSPHSFCNWLPQLRSPISLCIGNITSKAHQCSCGLTPAPKAFDFGNIINIMNPNEVMQYTDGRYHFILSGKVILRRNYQESETSLDNTKYPLDNISGLRMSQVEEIFVVLGPAVLVSN